jgi:hypothetical protein
MVLKPLRISLETNKPLKRSKHMKENILLGTTIVLAILTADTVKKHGGKVVDKVKSAFKKSEKAEESATEAKADEGKTDEATA